MRAGHEELQIRAPLVISDAGVFNTFEKLLPPHVRSHPGKVALVSPWASRPQCPQQPRCPQHPWCPQCPHILIVPVTPVSPPRHSRVSPPCPRVPTQAQVPPRVPAGVRSRLAMVRPGMGSFLVFVGLRGSAAELGLPPTNFWMYPHNDLDAM